MKTKPFRDLLEQRLTKEEIAEIERQAKAEVQALRDMQEKAKKKPLANNQEKNN